MNHVLTVSVLCLSLAGAVGIDQLKKHLNSNTETLIAEVIEEMEVKLLPALTPEPSASSNQYVDVATRDDFQSAPAMRTSLSNCPIVETGCKRVQGLPRASVRHIEGKGIGYGIGYTSLDLFFSPEREGRRFFPFLDLRGHIFDHGKFAANGGLGFRVLGTRRIWGMNAYYDYRNSEDLSYNQVGAGLEFLGTTWDFRANGYLPLGKTHTGWSHARFDHFQGNQFLVKRRQTLAMQGADAEAGAHFNRTKGWDFYLGAGPYYFEGRGKNAWGGKARLSSTYKDYFFFELSGSYDNVFKDIGQIQVGLSLPFAPKGYAKKIRKNSGRCSCRALLEDRVIQPVIRQEIIVEDRRHRSDLAIDPVTGLPYTFYFVDNLSNSAGTYESPYPTFQEALDASAAGDVIYIFPGDGTTAGLNALGTPFQLKDNQQILGASTAHPFNTTVGSIEIPRQTDLMPHLTGGEGSSVLFAANNNTISGLYLTADGTSGNPSEKIYCVGANSGTITDLTMTDNLLETFHTPTGTELTYGICFVQPNATIEGNVQILNNVFNIGAEDDNTDTKTFGIFMNHGDATTLIENNRFNGVLTGAISPYSALVITAADGSTVAIDVNKNEFTSFRNAITCNNQTSTDFIFFDISGSLNIRYNTFRKINNATGGAIDLGPAGTATDPSPVFTFSIDYNTFTDFGNFGSAISLLCARSLFPTANTSQTIETTFNCSGNHFSNTPVGSANSVIDIRPHFSATLTCLIEDNFIESYAFGTTTSAAGICIIQPSTLYTLTPGTFTSVVAKINGNQFSLIDIEAVRISNNVDNGSFPSNFCLQFLNNYAPNSVFTFFKNSPQTFNIEPLVGNSQDPRTPTGTFPPTSVPANSCP